MALILITEDAMFTRTVMRKALQKEGYEIIEANNGNQCLEMIRIYNPDCIILDLLMPQLSGYEVLEELQKKGSKIPVIIHTADIQETSRQHCLQMGAVAFINKPAKPDELRQALKKALNQEEKTTP